MKVSIAQRRKDGKVVTTLIEPVIKGGVHQIRVVILDQEPEVNEPNSRYYEKNGLRIARFFLDNEDQVQQLLIMIFGGYVAGLFDRKVAYAYRDNKLSEFYDV